MALVTPTTQASARKPGWVVTTGEARDLGINRSKERVMRVFGREYGNFRSRRDIVKSLHKVEHLENNRL